MRINIFNPKEQKKVKTGNYKKQGDYTVIVGISVIAIGIIIGLIVFNSVRNGNCLSMEEKVKKEAMNYIESNDLLPKYEGDSVTISIDEIDSLNLVFQGNICTGTVTITKADNRYIKTFDIQNCDYCTTNNRYSWSKKTEKYPKGKSLISVEMVYNYYDVTYNYTPWTDWFENELIDGIPTDDINMPLDKEEWPEIPKVGELIKYETEAKTFYSYRDQKWKFYKRINNNYSDFSSERPYGYTYKDEKTKIESEPSEWSTSYPEEFDYRDIETTNGYRWYYEDDNGKKVYYKDGKYVPKIEEKELKELYSEKEKGFVKMYRYTDSLWRWYNGLARDYSGFMNKPSAAYPYKDAEITQYSSWSRWSEVSNLNSSNESYREQKTNIHQRYRAYYLMHSNEKFNNYLNLTDFENATGRTLEEMLNDKNVKVLIKYQYRYGK